MPLIYSFNKGFPDLCRKYNLTAEVYYHADGITTWKAEVDDAATHPISKDPAYLAQVFEGMVQSGEIIAKRVAPPLCFVKIGGFVALADSGEKSADGESAGVKSVPVARVRSVLRAVMTNPETGACNGLLECVWTRRHISILFEQILEENATDRINYFIEPTICEVIPLKLAIQALKR